jgi:hypothetical protein
MPKNIILFNMVAEKFITKFSIFEEFKTDELPKKGEFVIFKNIVDKSLILINVMSEPYELCLHSSKMQYKFWVYNITKDKIHIKDHKNSTYWEEFKYDVNKNVFLDYLFEYEMNIVWKGYNEDYAHYMYSLLSKSNKYNII